MYNLFNNNNNYKNYKQKGEEKDKIIFKQNDKDLGIKPALTNHR